MKMKENSLNEKVRPNFWPVVYATNIWYYYNHTILVPKSIFKSTNKYNTSKWNAKMKLDELDNCKNENKHFFFCCLSVCVPCSTLAMRCMRGSQMRHWGGSATMSRNMLSITLFCTQKYTQSTVGRETLFKRSKERGFLCAAWLAEPLKPYINYHYIRFSDEVQCAGTCCGKQARATVCM